MLRFRRPHDSSASLAVGTPEKKTGVSGGIEAGGATPCSATPPGQPVAFLSSAPVAAPVPAGAGVPAPSTSARPRTESVEVIDYVGRATKRHTKRNRSIADAVALFHAATFTYHAWVWAWHWTPAAQGLPGASGFGWFFRYLTFYSYTAQTAGFGLAAAAALAPCGPSTKARLRVAADDAACAVFGLANVVTVLYYGLEAATAAVVEGGPVSRPPWLGRSVHVANAAAAWADLLLAHPRSFSPRAARASHALAATYAAWLLVVRLASGAFPYPILNALPMPAGYIGMTGTALALFAGLFALGRRLSTPLLRVKAKAGWPATD